MNSEWKAKVEEATALLEEARREAKHLSFEFLRMKTNKESVEEKVECIKKENRALTNEIKVGVELIFIYRSNKKKKL